MKTVLFVTVGGSPQPIVTAIQTLSPDRVIFICSDGPRGSLSQVTGQGSPCEVRKGSEVVEKLPNIPTQAGLRDFDPEQDVVLVQDPDDFAECYATITRKMAQISAAETGLTLAADYTGGTKTMSVTLALAALDYGAKLMLTTGNRRDLIRVDRGEMTEQASVAPVVVQRVLEQDLPTMVADYNYAAALQKLRQLRVNQDTSPATRQTIRQFYDLCSALDAWDRFDHLEAWAYLEPLMKQKWIQPLGLFLKRVMDSRSKIDPDFDGSLGSPGHGYEIVEDLLLNAERRASQCRFDDAVGRVYRALELLAQIHLKLSYDITTGDVDPNKLPEAIRPQFQSQFQREGKIELPLRKSYNLLGQLPGDPLGELFQERQSLIADALQVRNYSLFAHGFKPITQSDYQKIQGSLVAFIREGLQWLTKDRKKSQAPQFPQHFLFDQP
ncbi:MAG: TIGR02710 family CRISPR-associated CARF protein [Thermostichus sp. HHBFW_bins_43]